MSELFQEIPCLDHGFIRLVDVMGDDQAIVQAARLSIAGENVKAVSEDRALIRYLYRHRHTTPFEMVEFKFHCKMPIFVARQWIRHRTANVNEMSGRYSELPEEYYVPDTKDVKFQATKNKQGRSNESLPHTVVDRITQSMREDARAAFFSYRQYLEDNVARELARINLPLSTYTEWYWKIDLHNLFHFLALRLHEHAQYEIRVFAEAMAGVVQQVCPLAWEAFVDFRLEAHYLSKPEWEHLREFLTTYREVRDALDDPDALLLHYGKFPTKREEAEYKEKLRSLGKT